MDVICKRHLYAIIDLEVTETPLELADAVLQKGCAWLQLRAKQSSDRVLLEIATALLECCRRTRTPFVMNDRPDLAKVVGADGLHLGQDDVTIADARRVVGEMSIGVSTHSLEQAIEAERAGADLVAFGPIFKTTTKTNPDPTVGLDALREVCGAVGRPVVAIGGITPENAFDVLEAGATCVAVISALPGFVELV